MEEYKVNKTIKQINEKIKRREAVVVNAEEMMGIVEKEGIVGAAKKVDVVTTGTFGTMCSSGAFINFGHTTPRIKAYKAWLNDVPVYAGLAAVDLFIGATSVREGDPLNKVHPGSFSYGGGHVIEDLIAKKKVELRVAGYGTDCYPRTSFTKKITIRNLSYATLCNPRNACQNYTCAVNTSDKTVYTYMGVLKPHLANATYSSAGQLSPLLNDPFYLTIGVGTRIFLGGGIGYIISPGTQHNPDVERTEKGIVLAAAGTLACIGDMKGMNPDFVKGVSILGYGTSLTIGIGIPIPILNEEIAYYTGISDEDIYVYIEDYGYDYPQNKEKIYGKVNYKQLKSGYIEINGENVPSFPMSSYFKAIEVAETLKSRIKDKKFFISEPQERLPRGKDYKPKKYVKDV
jgi:uncharacterized protein (DUF39 family)